MSKLFYKTIIDDVQNQNCTTNEVQALLNIFENTIKDIARTLARKADFDLNDFATAKKNNVQDFSLVMRKQFTNGQEQWVAHFANGTKNLDVLGSLERD